MTTIETTSRVGADGVLTLSLPLETDVAGQDVTVTIKPARKVMTENDWKEWHQFLHETAGTWQGEFERPPQGELEVRDAL